MKNNMTKTILITGASRGFGKIWAEAFLKRGDRVAVAVRNTESIKHLSDQYGDSVFPVQLDVSDRNRCFEAVDEVKKRFGTIDVLINNAGSGLFGTVEEAGEQEVRDQFETNVYGLLWMTQAVLPIMRHQGSGHIIQVSSVLGVATMPVLGIYNATKFAVEGLSETLSTEVFDFGIKVTLLEPNGYATDWAPVSALHSAPIAAYNRIREGFQAGFTDDVFGVPEATSEAVLQLVDSENPPLRLFLGKLALPWVKQVYAQRLSVWDQWADVSVAAHGK
jgi:NADP-dependent 3-hydroxy acid dehydrogenase YdfG